MSPKATHFVGDFHLRVASPRDLKRRQPLWYAADFETLSLYLLCGRKVNFVWRALAVLSQIQTDSLEVVSHVRALHPTRMIGPIVLGSTNTCNKCNFENLQIFTPFSVISATVFRAAQESSQSFR